METTKGIWQEVWVHPWNIFTKYEKEKVAVREQEMT